MPDTIFPENFILALETLINVHHSIYDELPPQGNYFEALVEKAFKRIKKPFTVIQATGRNQPRHDLLVENARISFKTETGLGTKPRQISITKLCTTEREPWQADVLLRRAAEHLSGSDHLLMLRAIWRLPLIHYQLVEIPVSLLRLMASGTFAEVGRRVGRRSIGGDILQQGQFLYRVHFDGSDGKCQVRNLDVGLCNLLHEWDLKVAW